MARRTWLALVFIVMGVDVAAAQSTGGGARLSPFARVKAESLLQNQLPCLGCHTLNGSGGKLGPDLSSVRTRRDAGYIVRMISDPQSTVPGTLMPHTPMPAAWRALIIDYLGGDAKAVASPVATTRGTPRATVATGITALEPISAPPADTAGAALYTRFCSGCHGPNGNGDGPNAGSLPVPPARHASRDAMSVRSDDALFDTIAGGGAIMNRSPRMPAFGTTLTSTQIRALVRHIRSLCGCTGPQWSTDGATGPRE